MHAHCSSSSSSSRAVSPPGLRATTTNAWETQHYCTVFVVYAWMDGCMYARQVGDCSASYTRSRTLYRGLRETRSLQSRHVVGCSFVCFVCGVFLLVSSVETVLKARSPLVGCL